MHPKMQGPIQFKKVSLAHLVSLMHLMRIGPTRASTSRIPSDFSEVIKLFEIYTDDLKYDQYTIYLSPSCDNP